MTVNDGAGGLSQSASFTQTVNSVAHSLTITQQPSGNPNPVASGGAVNMSVAANDSLSHTLALRVDGDLRGPLGGNGSFANGTTATPTWTAPANLTGSAQTCAIQVTVNDGAGGLSQSASFTQTVNSVPHSLTITQQPSGNPNPVASGGAVNMSVAATDSLNHTLAYAWSATLRGPARRQRLVRQRDDGDADVDGAGESHRRRRRPARSR